MSINCSTYSFSKWMILISIHGQHPLTGVIAWHFTDFSTDTLHTGDGGSCMPFDANKIWYLLWEIFSWLARGSKHCENGSKQVVSILYCHSHHINRWHIKIRTWLLLWPPCLPLPRQRLVRLVESTCGWVSDGCLYGQRYSGCSWSVSACETTFFELKVRTITNVHCCMMADNTSMTICMKEWLKVGLGHGIEFLTGRESLTWMEYEKV